MTTSGELLATAASLKTDNLSLRPAVCGLQRKLNRAHDAFAPKVLVHLRARYTFIDQEGAEPCGLWWINWGPPRLGPHQPQVMTSIPLDDFPGEGDASLPCAQGAVLGGVCREFV